MSKNSIREIHLGVNAPRIQYPLPLVCVFVTRKNCYHTYTLPDQTGNIRAFRRYIRVRAMMSKFLVNQHFREEG